MEEEGIWLVLARATELRLKISNCVHTATTTPNGDADDDDETTQRLLSICDALEALETQLSSLQVLQQQQRYEREVALAEIENSRKMLTDKLKEYQGKELEVIHEACSFASERVEPNNDLLLPPYPSRPPYSMRLDKEYQTHIPSVNKYDCNGLITHDPMIEAQKSTSEKEQNHVDDDGKSARKGWGLFISRVSKTVVTVVGVVSILSLSGFGPKLGKVGIRFNVQGLRRQTKNEKEIPATENEGVIPITQCPPGRVLVIENGEARCLVKERIEIPFSTVAAIPDIYYGSG